MGPAAVATLLVQGMFLGGLYALAGYGFSISLGIIREINVAHGDLMILAAYISLAVLSTWRTFPLLSLLLTVPAMFIVGWLLQRSLLNRALRRGPSHVVVVTFALGIVIENLLLILFSYNNRTLATGYLLQGISLGAVRLPLVMAVDFAASVVVLAALQLIMGHTMLGRAMRAVPANEPAARIIGIRPERIYPLAMGLAMAVNAVAGVLLGSTFVFYPSVGPDYMLIAFGTVILGGLGSLLGTFIGGLVMGEVFVLSGHTFGATYQMMATLIVIFMIMVLSPRGILRGEIF
ncbi:MAG TPA: branched-chain amino acid ABC transporter permease [Nitrososphaeria archaeon]|jgi:branched-chain amino acid transport system permease protein|nr:MAG: branched-chain amino acid ABC transporter permease [Nitrososphaera sp.]HEU16482.1 branched-chain amino acid ABC transporter permease [Nitrososphaeria archaeon]